MLFNELIHCLNPCTCSLCSIQLNCAKIVWKLWKPLKHLSEIRFSAQRISFGYSFNDSCSRSLVLAASFPNHCQALRESHNIPLIEDDFISDSTLSLFGQLYNYFVSLFCTCFKNKSDQVQWEAVGCLCGCVDWWICAFVCQLSGFVFLSQELSRALVSC